MILTLEIINPESLAPGVEVRKVFRGRGGTIGKLPESDWYLPHESVSRRHAVLQFQGGVFLIQDTSLNGVFINSKQNRLAKGETCELKNGDVVIIEPYEIRVQVSHSDAAPALGGFLDPDVNLDNLFDPVTGARKPVVHRPLPPESEIMDLPSFKPVAGDASVHFPDDFLGGPPPPPPPDDDPFSRGGVEKRTPGPPAPARTEGLLNLAEVLSAAGLQAPVVAPDLARDFGRILRVVVTGVMEVLRSRQQLKSEFRVEGTAYKPRDNNPLKFSVDVEDALYNLLVKRHPGYLGPVPAFEDAFGDIQDHEVAMLAGMRAAFETMLTRFDPAALQEEFDRRIKKGAFVAVPGKLRYWELYSERFRDMVRDPEASFRDLFGDEFANAYEEQLKRLKARRRDTSL